MTRTRAEIERELEARRADLEAGVHLLDDMVRERLDVKRRAKAAARRGAAEASELASRLRAGARARPATAVLVVVTFALLIALQLRARRAARRRSDGGRARLPAIDGHNRAR